LVDEVSGYPNLAGLGDWHLRAAEADPELLVPMRLAVGADELSLFTTLTVFGTPQDVTLAELAVELFYPADDHSQDLLRRR
jgi:hypothetical protein